MVHGTHGKISTGTYRGLVQALKDRYQSVSRYPGYMRMVLLSLLAISGAFLVNLYAIRFATEWASNQVTDLILSNTPIFEVDELFVYGTFFLLGFVILISLTYPKRIPFSLYSMALFWVIRAVFVSLTHLGPISSHTVIDFGATVQRFLFSGHDYFFSGHTGTPFLFALLYWRERAIRYAFLALSIALAMVVLLGHLHYSIDVFAAFFITYSIYQIAVHSFPRSRSLFLED
jgi:hypothetical protein